jgi:hypothetical protein
MLWPGYEGPKEQWQAEMERLNRFGLRAFAEALLIHFEFVGIRLNPQSLMETVGKSKKYGRFDAAHVRHQRFMADPHKYINESIRRSKAAKKAARRRKKAR